MKNLTILGSTGSIGKNTLEVVRNNPSELSIKALAAGNNWELLAEQAIEFKPELVSINNAAHFELLSEKLKNTGTKVLVGQDGLIEASELKSADTLISSVVGAAGLEPTMHAILAGKDVCLANKETLVVGGEFVIDAVKKMNVSLTPVDSEHSAIFQCIGSNNAKAQSVRKIIITASGGPFRTWPNDKIQGVKVEDALKHPNWSMGGKITIDSATLMNKGLEVIEAHWLFDMAYEDIEVVVHPQSIIHSLVEFSDGSVLAQLGWPDMKLPIQYALSWPKRWSEAVSSLDLLKVATMTFEKPRIDDFPCLKYAFEAGKIGGGKPCVLNAANEIAVAAFMAREIGFTEIADIVKDCMDNITIPGISGISDLLALDLVVRNYAKKIIASMEKQ